MTAATVVTLLISGLLIQICVGIKCYHQECSEDEDGPGHRCVYGAEGNGGIDGEVGEDDTGCYEMRHVRNGKLFVYHRNIIHREGYDSSEKAKVKEGCVTEKDKSAGVEEEWEICYCFKDLCNNKYKTPEGAKLGYGDEE